MFKANKRGITLIALIITIIVLLILAGVVINLLTGNNNVLEEANSASEKMIIEDEKEALSIAYSACRMEKLDENAGKKITDQELQKEMNSNGRNVEVSLNEEDLEVLYTDTQNKYIITQKGEIRKVENIEEVKKDLLVNYEWVADVPTDSWFSNPSYYDVEWEGSGTETVPYLISSEEELAGISYKVANGETFEGKYFKLTKNLSMEEHIWIPIGRT